jgi:perosamine synthetase
VLVPENVDRDLVITDLARAGVETRPFFVPMHACPPYFEEDGATSYPISAQLGKRGISLPSSATLTDESLGRISGLVRDAFARQLAGSAVSR